MKADLAEIARTLEVLYQPGDVVELRVPKTARDGTVSGYFDDHRALATALASRNGAVGVYVTLNPTLPALLARCANRIQTHARSTTSDHDVLCRRWLLVDCDPVRPADISSTDTEHEAALERARDIKFVLSEEGWPTPILADSGNGAHLLYALDLPNDDSATKLLAGVLKYLAGRFNNAAVKVDEGVSNAGRITKAYGTVAAKGDDLPDRPHRLSRLLEVPPHIEPVPLELLEAATPTEPPPPRPSPNSSRGGFNIDDFIARHLQARDPVPHEGGRKWVLEECPFNPEHQDAAIVERAGGAIWFKCFHNSCAGKGWKEVRAPFGVQSPQPHAEDGPRSYDNPLLAARSILKMELPIFEFAIESLFTMPGAWLVVGGQKAGKSLLAMQAALSLNAQVPFLDRYECRIGAPCPVLVIEQDDPSQLAAVQLILKKTDIAFDPDTFYSVEKASFCIEPLFIDYLEQRIASEGLRVIVLDSYTAIRGPRRGRCDVVKVESGEMQCLDSLAKRTGILIFLIHHTSRGHAGLDWAERASGSFAVGAAVEGQVFIERYPEFPVTAPERLVRIQARHLSGIEMTIRLDERTLNYELVLDGAAAPFFPTLHRIHEEFGVAAFSPKTLAHATGLARATIHRLIARLIAGNVARKVGYGEYKLNPFLKL